MYRVDMYFTIKTLKEKGFSKRRIAKELGIHRDTVTRILELVSKGQMDPPPIQKEKLLDNYRERIEEWIEQGKTSVLIHEFLLEKHGLEVAYPTVVKYVRSLKQDEVYIPLLSEPGEEAQVDFGYFGRFNKDGRLVKVWCFSMVLSNSRYSYHEVVTDQCSRTFINCHIHSFEYFGGVPATVKIDNLKAGVITPGFFEPVIQHQYAGFLSYYGSTPITARIRRGQDKGKVESGVKYVKNNFLKRVDHNDYYQLAWDIERWTNTVCNQRLHGTTRKIPAKVFNQIEKSALLPLPSGRYEVFEIEKRKVSTFFHIAYKYNYYSVPYQYAGKELVVQSNGSVLKIYKDNDQIALHSLSSGQGEYITKEEHKPPYKQKKSREYYQTRIASIGPHAIEFMEELEKIKPRHWHEMLRGILSLEKCHSKQNIDLSCARALSYGAISYREVKSILEQKLYEQQEIQEPVPVPGGYGHELSTYDKL